MTSESPGLLRSPGARALLVGSGRYDTGSLLSPVPAVEATLAGLADCLTGPAGLDPGGLTVLADPLDPMALAAALAEATRDATDVFLFCYVGHGVLNARGDELHLTTRATMNPTDAVPFMETFSYSAVREALSRCPAERVVTILDCCFSGRAGAPRGGAAGRTFDNTRLPGGYLLASSSDESVSFAPVGETYTAFSGELIRLLREGDPTGPAQFTLDHLYVALSRAMAARGFPRPHREVADLGDQGPFAPNPAYHPKILAAPPPVPQDDSVSPYRGLGVFGPEDADLFFGRDELTETLTGRALADGLLVVTGPSGSGKSSLLRAGLIPALQRLDGRPCMIMAPGTDPLGELIRSLAPAPTGDLRERLTGDPRLLRELVASETEPRTVIVVDQFEEVFTAPIDETEMALFIRVLTELCRGYDSPALVVLGLRSDFFGPATRFGELQEALSRPVLVTPMTAEQLREAIERPAELAGLSFEAGLVDLLLEDLGTGTLPLLSHALLATWHHRVDGVLTLAGYRTAGGIRRSLAQSADETLQDLDEEGREFARKLLVELVRVGDIADTRRRVPVAELAAGEGRDILARLVRARLVNVDGQTAELAHEALIQAWPKLQGWITEDRTRILVRQQLHEDARAWERQSRDPAYLYSATRLAAARDALAGGADPGAPLVQSFLDAGARQENRRRNVVKGVIASLVTLLLISVVAGVTAFLQSRETARQRDTALSGRIAEAANSVADESLGAQLSVLAFRLGDTAEARGALLTAAHRNPGVRLLGHTATVWRVRFSPDGRTLATGSWDGTARLWDVTDPFRPAALGVMRSAGGGRVLGVAFAPDGRTVATGSTDATIRLWDVTDRVHPRQVALVDVGNRFVTGLVFGSDGTTLAALVRPKDVRRSELWLWEVDRRENPMERSRTRLPAYSDKAIAMGADDVVAVGGYDGKTRLWDISDPGAPALRATVGKHTDAVIDVSFGAGGRRLATGSLDKSVRLWDVRDLARIKEIAVLSEHTDGVQSVALSIDGRSLVTTGGDYTMRMWDLQDPAHPVATAATGHFAIPRDAVFDPGGTVVVSGSSDAKVRLWRFPLTGEGQMNHGGIVHVAFDPRGSLVATPSYDASVGLWDVRDIPRPRLVATLKGHDTSVQGAAFSPDGHILVTAEQHGESRLWDVTDPANPVVLNILHNRGDDYVSAVSFSPDGRFIALSYGDRVRLWDVSTPSRPKLGALIPAHEEFVNDVVFSPDGRLLATASGDFTAKLWDVSDLARPRMLSVLQGHTFSVNALAFSPDGRTLATGSGDAAVRLWDVGVPAKPAPVATLKGHLNGVLALAFSPDGKSLATGSSDTTTRLWDVADRRSPHASAVLRQHRNFVGSVAFSPDGRSLATGSQDWTARILQLDAERAARRVCEVSGAPITEAEWDQYVSELDYSPPCS
ncbi:caspase, EACC1-associated type [Streptosporangium sandarakinum]|uniref:caspase, EACC1-associated type n=1 Tax=Streptosporangium sandarakinum TaxID=1260955 RepID=UPI003D8C8A57